MKTCKFSSQSHYKENKNHSLQSLSLVFHLLKSNIKSWIFSRIYKENEVDCFFVKNLYAKHL